MKIELGTFGLLTKTVLNTMAEIPGKFKEDAHHNVMEKYNETLKRKKELKAVIVELKNQIPEIEWRYKSLLVKDKASLVTVDIDGLSIPLTVQQIVETVKRELDLVTEKHEKLSRAYYNLCKDIENYDKKHNISAKLEEKEKMKNRAKQEPEERLTKLIPELIKASYYLKDNDMLEFDLFRLYRNGNKIGCYFDGLFLSSDLETGKNIVGSENDKGVPDIFAIGNSSSVEELDWLIELTYGTRKHLEVMHLNIEDFIESVNKNMKTAI